MITTTLRAIKEHEPLKISPEKLISSLREMGEDEPLKFSTILERSGLHNAMWCLRLLPEKYSPQIINLAADIAERVLPIFEEEYPEDKSPRKAIQAARDFVSGKIDSNDALFAANIAFSAANYATAPTDADYAISNAGFAAANASYAAAHTGVAACYADEASDNAYAVYNTAAYYATNADREKEEAEHEKLLIKYFG